MVSKDPIFKAVCDRQNNLITKTNVSLSGERSLCLETQSLNLATRERQIQSSDSSSAISDLSVSNGSLSWFLDALPKILKLVISQNGKAYVEIESEGNNYAVSVGSKRLNNLIREYASQNKIKLRKNDLGDINSHLQALAEIFGKKRSVWYRVAPIDQGVLIDLGGESHIHVKVTQGKVETVVNGSEILFYRTATQLPMVVPAELGNLGLLDKYLNLSAPDILLFKAWLSYTLAHPKVDESKYVILLLQATQGSGKSFLCRNIILGLLDPSLVNVQILPNKLNDLAIAAQNSHVLCYDNLRYLSHQISDALCIASTGGSMATRKLYSDDEQQILNIHVALVLNGIYNFVDQPDLAQRCLPIEMLELKPENRKSEGTLVAELQLELPVIFRGLLDLIAGVLAHLPNVELQSPERMVDFSKWLAAMELYQQVPVGVYQSLYTSVVQQGQLDSLLENVVADALLQLLEYNDETDWSGTPTQLLNALERLIPAGTKKSRDWPTNPIALSKRLKPLQGSLATQGVRLAFTRGKERYINITYDNSKGKSYAKNSKHDASVADDDRF